MTPPYSSLSKYMGYAEERKKERKKERKRVRG
jgi:hypothetical protein